MSNLQKCLSAAELRDRVRQPLPDEDAEQLARHLEKCAACATTVEALLRDDTLAGDVRRSKGLDAAMPVPGTRDLIERLCRLRAIEELTTASPSPPILSTSALTFLSPPLGPGELGRLGSFRILKQLGEGGMGMVFLAEDPMLERRVALKVMRPELAKPEQKQRFLREARAAAKVKHDHVVTIYQVGVEGEVPFLAMDLLEGESLDDWLKRGQKASPAVICRIGREVAEGLAAAHNQGLMHRDIKPGNLWLEKFPGERGASAPRWRVKILDFGLARATQGQEQLTSQGAIVGTPAYAAPEQFRGEAEIRSDLFSLGAVLYRLCTGKMPFKGKDLLSIVASVSLDTAAPVRSLNPDVPRELSDLVMQLLAKEAKDRPASAREVADRLLAIERTLRKPVSTEQTVTSEPEASAKVATDRRNPLVADAPRTPRKRRWVAIAAGLAASLLLLGGVWVIIRDKKGNEVGRLKVPDGGKVEVMQENQPADNDRAAAEVLRSVKCSLDVRLASGKFVYGIWPDQPLPAEPFRITVVRIHGDARSKQEGFLAALAGLSQVAALNDHFNGFGWTDADLVQLVDTPFGRSLTTFESSKLMLTLEMIRTLTRFPRLEQLSVTMMKINSPGAKELVAALPKCKLSFDGGVLDPRQSPFPPLDPAWVKKLQALPAEEQLKEVAAELKRRNPGFDGNVDPVYQGKKWLSIQDGVVGSLRFCTDAVTDISPVRALPGLKGLGCWGSGPGKGVLSDLSPLRGTSINRLICENNPIHDLAPLQGLRLSDLWCDQTAISDLTPLKGMALKILSFRKTKIADLSPLAGMPLNILRIDDTPVSDLRPLAGMPLNELYFWGTGVTDLSVVAGLPLNAVTCNFSPWRDAELLRLIKTLGWINNAPAVEFWKQVDAERAKFDDWAAKVAKLPPEDQVKEVLAELTRRNPKFDATAAYNKPVIERGAVTGLYLVADELLDLAPVRALPALRHLYCPGSKIGSGKLNDLSPLRGLKLHSLSCDFTQVRDLSPLSRMPLTKLWIAKTQVADISVLRGMPLQQLHGYGTPIRDLTPLLGLPLTHVWVDFQPVSDAAVLGELKRLNSLVEIDHKPAAQFWKEMNGPGTPFPPLDPTWVKVVQSMPPDDQVKEVIAELKRRNPAFDGVGTRFEYEDGVVIRLNIVTDEITDLGPVRALAGLKTLNLLGNPANKRKLADLSPLNGMLLEQLTFAYTSVSDLSPLRGMPLTKLYCGDSKVSDISVVGQFEFCSRFR